MSGEGGGGGLSCHHIGSFSCIFPCAVFIYQHGIQSTAMVATGNEGNTFNK